MPNPLPNVPVRDFYSPILEDSLLIEFSSSKIGDYTPLEVGAPYPKKAHTAAQVDLFDGHTLLGQKAIGDNNEFLRRIFATDPVREDTYNFALTYSGSSAAHRIYLRTYLERRDQYIERARGSTLTGIYGVRVTAAGAGYTAATVAAAGGTGSGWTGSVVLSNDGTVLRVVTQTEGSYTVAPTITISGDGAAATAVAQLQTVSCVLIDEEAKPAEDPWGPMWFRVTRIYETLPGPGLPFTRYDVFLGPIQGTRTAVLNTGQAASLTAGGKTTYEARDGSSVVSWQLIETWDSSNFAGAGQIDDLWDNERGAFQRVTQLVVAAGSEVASLVISAGVATEITYEAYNQFLLKKITETWANPGAATNAKLEFDEFGGLETTTKTRTILSVTPTNTVVSTVPHVQRLDAISLKEAELYDTIRTVGSIVTDIDQIDPSVPGSRATREYYLVLASTTIPADTNVITYERKRYPADKNLRLEIKTTYAIPAEFEESESKGYPFPQIFYDFYKDDIIGANLNARASYSNGVVHRVLHHFGTTKLAPLTTQIVEATWTLFNWSGHGLTNAEAYSTTVGGTVYTYNLPASIPTRTTYLALVAGSTELEAGGVSKIYHAGIYKTTYYYVIAR